MEKITKISSKDLRKLPSLTDKKKIKEMTEEELEEAIKNDPDWKGVNIDFE